MNVVIRQKIIFSLVLCFNSIQSLVPQSQNPKITKQKIYKPKVNQNGKKGTCRLWNIVPLFGSGCYECCGSGLSHRDYLHAYPTRTDIWNQWSACDVYHNWKKADQGKVFDRKRMYKMCRLDIFFSSNHNIHKTSCGPLFLGSRSFHW